MKIHVDTTAKVIKIEGDVKLGELYDFLERMLPGEWKNWTLDTSATIVNWISKEIVREPVFIDPPVYPGNPYFPLQPSIPSYPPYYYNNCTVGLDSCKVIPMHTFSVRA